MNEETLVKVDSLVLEKGNMTIMAGNMAAGRQADTRAWAENLHLIYRLATGREEMETGPAEGFWNLQGHPSDKPSSRLQLQILPKQSASYKPLLVLVSCKPVHFKVALKAAEK